jgi:MerR family transcriptional regulator, mercuric resistance operon regulatory protein
MAPRLLSIGEVARISGVSRDAIRYYERLALVPAPARTAAGYRLYGQEVLNRLTLVQNAKRLGFSLTEIAGFLRLRDRGEKPCHAVRDAGARRLRAIDEQVAQLRITRKQMAVTLRSWDRALERTRGDQLAHLLEMLDSAISPLPSRSGWRPHMRR